MVTKHTPKPTLPLVIKWRPRARKDYETIIDGLRANYPPAADALVDLMKSKLNQLISFPKMYKPGRVKGTHEMPLKPNYIVVYTVDAAKIRIVGVFHSKQNWTVI